MIIVPELAVKEEFNDNVRFTTDDSEEDFITHVTPAFSLISQKHQQKIEARAEACVKKYIREDILDQSLDRFDRSFEINGSFLTPQGNRHTFHAGYDRTIDPEKEIYDSGERYDGNWGRFKRDQAALAYDSSGRMSEYSFFTCRIHHLAVDYKSKDYMAAVNSYGELTLGKELTDTLSLYVRPCAGYGLGNYDRWVMAEENTEVKNMAGFFYWAGMGVLYEFSSDARIDAWGGVRQVHMDYKDGIHLYDEGRIIKSEAVTAPAGGVKFDWKGDDASFTLSFDMDLALSGKILFVDKKSVNVAGRKKISDYWDVDLSAGYVTTRSVSDFFSLDSERYFVTPKIAYQTGENSKLALSYTYSMFSEDGDQKDATRNQVFIEFAAFFDFQD